MSARVPLPPDALAIRVGVNDPAAPGESFEALGAHARNLIVDILPDSWSFEGKRVLDFGCGPGKVLRLHSGVISGAFVTGSTNSGWAGPGEQTRM